MDGIESMTKSTYNNKVPKLFSTKLSSTKEFPVLSFPAFPMLPSTKIPAHAVSTSIRSREARKRKPKLWDDYITHKKTHVDNNKKISLPKFSTHFQDPKSPKIKCPALTQKQINLLFLYLYDPDKYINDKNFLILITSSNFDDIPTHMVSSFLWYWGKVLGKKKVNGIEQLYNKETKKLILAKEEHKRKVKEAHEGTGYFIWADVSRDEKGRAIHNDYMKTLALIENEYGIGDREFGLNKTIIYDHIANCDCSWKIKNLPAFSKMIDDTGKVSSTSSSALQQESFDADAHNESNSINLENAPMTMLWSPPTSSSIWYDQKGLASEQSQYGKLVGVIHELGLEIGAMVQGDVSAKEKFLTKLYCADRFIKETKEKIIVKSKTLQDSNFVKDYTELHNIYVENGKLDVFLYDVNLLAMRYKLSTNSTFLKMVNHSVSQFQDRVQQMKDLQKHMKTATSYQSQSNVSDDKKRQEQRYRNRKIAPKIVQISDKSQVHRVNGILRNVCVTSTGNLIYTVPTTPSYSISLPPVTKNSSPCSSYTMVACRPAVESVSTDTNKVKEAFTLSGMAALSKTVSSTSTRQVSIDVSPTSSTVLSKILGENVSEKHCELPVLSFTSVTTNSKEIASTCLEIVSTDSSQIVSSQSEQTHTVLPLLSCSSSVVTPSQIIQNNIAVADSEHVLT